MEVCWSENGQEKSVSNISDLTICTNRISTLDKNAVFSLVTRFLCSWVIAGFPFNIKNRWGEKRTTNKHVEAAASEGPTGKYFCKMWASITLQTLLFEVWWNF